MPNNQELCYNCIHAHKIKLGSTKKKNQNAFQNAINFPLSLVTLTQNITCRTLLMPNGNFILWIEGEIFISEYSRTLGKKNLKKS